MKKSTVFGYVLVVLFFLSSSCTVEKRLHLSGYHVEWLNGKQSKKAVGNNESTIAVQHKSHVQSFPDIAVSDNDLIAGTNGNPALPVIKRDVVTFGIKAEKKGLLKLEECDVMTLKNGDELQVKVLEIGTSEIKYKRCDNLQGPTITIRKSEVFSIKYPNGTKEMISTSSSSSLDPTNLVNPNGDKSLIITLVLWFFLGLLGIHRFYLGHIGMGILYLLTGALCGIGWIIDLILLLTGGLKPKNGEFTDSL